MAELDRFPCPSCGFLVFQRSAGSKETCPICRWQDDGLQLAYPGMVGGLNGLSLFDFQQKILPSFPAKEREFSGVPRHPTWRPLQESEAALRKGVRITGRMYVDGAGARYYWM